MGVAVVGLAVVQWLAVVCSGGLSWIAAEIAVQITVGLSAESAMEISMVRAVGRQGVP